MTKPAFANLSMMRATAFSWSDGNVGLKRDCMFIPPFSMVQE